MKDVECICKMLISENQFGTGEMIALILFYAVKVVDAYTHITPRHTQIKH